MARSKRQKQVQSTEVLGKARYTVTRFLSDCTEKTRKFLLDQWSEGNQLVAGRVPVDGLPPVMIMAGYARVYGVELVDDFNLLVERFQSHIKECFHPDKFMASCICILHERDQVPDEESFEAINVPTLYEELLQ